MKITNFLVFMMIFFFATMLLADINPAVESDASEEKYELGISGANKTFIQETKADGRIVVTDLRTNLMWTYNYALGYTWKNGLKYCEELNYGEYTDWRLPNISELQSLFNKSASFPATDNKPASDFPNISSVDYWSSSSTREGSNYAEYVNYYNGWVTFYSKTNLSAVRCVRP